MQKQRQANQTFQASVKDARDHLDAEKSRGVHPPRTVAEEVEDMTSDVHGVDHRRRDPLKAASRQRDEREPAGPDSVAPMQTSQRANAVEVGDLQIQDEDAPAKNRQWTGDSVQSGPSHNPGS